MADDPFEPPRTPLKDEKAARKQRPNLLAIVIGALVDVASTTIAGTIFGIGIMIFGGEEGMKPEQFQAMLADSTGYMVASYGLGLACSVFGGFVCARFANQNEYANGLAVGLLGVISGELMASSSADLWTHLIGLLTIPAALLGAHIKMQMDKA